MKPNLFIALASLLLAIRAGAVSVDYLTEIKPLLTQHCVKCHGATKPKGELRADTAAALIKGGESGPSIVPGKSKESLSVLLVEGPHGELAQMPFKKPALMPDQIVRLKQWVDEGAKFPADEKPGVATHWAFVAPKRPVVPAVGSKSAVIRNLIDAFIVAQLEKAGVAPSPEADRYTLIRRLSLDLTGLPPTPAEVDAFAKDLSADAYERLVDRLLASPHHGERWGRWWLDVARYADSNGYSIDAPRQIWKYRDWVVAALNRNQPFDQFTIAQLAGDLLPDATLEQRIATGFHRNTQINQEGGIDKEQFRIESIFDRVGTTGTAFLGLTVACAQCHDHKFDPLSQREFYQFFAFFNGADEPTIEAPQPGEIERRKAHREQVKELEAGERKFRQDLLGKLPQIEAAMTPEQKAKFAAPVRTALAVPPPRRSAPQKKAIYEAVLAASSEHKGLVTRIAKMKKEEPTVTTTLVMAERKESRETRRFEKGDFTRPQEVVTPGVPAVLHPLKRSLPAHPAAKGKAAATGGKLFAAKAPDPAPVENAGEARFSRLELAKWIVDPANPLTARVTVNRIWQQYFGRGIVETENDFGTQGLPPSHPELLDWLATEFLAQKWNLKAMHKLIVMSATYRQSSKARSDLMAVDASNKLLARQSRLRLDAEIVRDATLAASGLLSPRMGGPPVYPPQPEGVMALGQVKRQWKVSDDSDRYRRGLYTFFYRGTPHPALSVFDAPDGFSTCTRRLRSNTPLQALTMLNDQQFYEFARGLAVRMLTQGLKDDAGRIEHGFRLCLARPPVAEERERLLALLEQQRQRNDPGEHTPAGWKLIERPAGMTSPQFAAWIAVARVLLNLDETITRE